MTRIEPATVVYRHVDHAPDDTHERPGDRGADHAQGAGGLPRFPDRPVYP